MTVLHNFEGEPRHDTARAVFPNLKERAFSTGIPLRAELLDMVYQSDEELGMETKKKRLGFNSSQLHLDIYMNELLQGMRIIYQVLPVINSDDQGGGKVLDLRKLHGSRLFGSECSAFRKGVLGQTGSWKSTGSPALRGTASGD